MIPSEFKTEIGCRYLLNLFVAIVALVVSAVLIISSYGVDIFIAILAASWGLLELNKYSLGALRRKARRGEVENENRSR